MDERKDRSAYAIGWDNPQPFAASVTVEPEHIDGLM